MTAQLRIPVAPGGQPGAARVQIPVAPAGQAVAARVQIPVAPAGQAVAARVQIPVARADRPVRARVRIPVTHVDETFRALGSSVRIVITAPDARGLLARARVLLHDFEACASRFRPGSELCALNADPRAAVPASRQLRDAVRAAVWAAGRSGGLVDPCLLDALEAAGYRESFTRAAAPVETPSWPARPARPHPATRWQPDRGGRAPRHDRAAAGTAARPRRLGQGPRGRPDRAAARLRPLVRDRRRRGRPRRRRSTRSGSPTRCGKRRPRSSGSSEAPSRRRASSAAHGAAPAAAPRTTCSTRRRASRPGPACSR